MRPAIRRPALALHGLLLICAILLGACRSAPPALTNKVGVKAYTKVGLFYEKNLWWSTNFQKGVRLEPGSEVQVCSVSNSEILVQLPSGLQLRLVNKAGHTGCDIAGLYERTLSEQPVVPTVRPQFAEAVKNGQPVLGMNKSELLAACGYPPITLTPSISASVWTYQLSRFNKIAYTFEGDILKGIRD